MNLKLFTAGLISILVSATALDAQDLTLGNGFLERQLSLSPYLHTSVLDNRTVDKCMDLQESPEFLLRLSDGTDQVGTDRWLTARDFKVVSHTSYPLKGKGKGQGLKVSLYNAEEQFHVDVFYELLDGKPYLHKYLVIKPGKKVTLERVDIDALYLEGAFQPYQESQITANASKRWRPGLGQPLYDYINATWWGTEFPAASNKVVDQEIRLGYLWGRELQPNQEYTTYKAVMGVSDDPMFLDDAFYSYIDDVRIRPLRFRLQFNSWFDQGYEVDEQGFLASCRKINEELCEKRGIRPFDSYVIDDGWQDNLLPDYDKDGKVWVTNEKFSKDFKESHKVLKKMGAEVGLWMSPASCFRAVPQTEVLRSKGLEAHTICMSLTGERYMQKFEDRMIELSRQGVNYFKLDGTFGHLNIREYELHGRGCPAMPQLPVEGLAPNDIRLNDPMYDELKSYYIVAGTERLIRMMDHHHQVDPDTYTAITNGAYLSPWWLMHTDAVWLINCGDAAGGSNRNDELVYRDGIYYDTFIRERTKFPLHSVWNHEPKKVNTGESEQEFRDYLFMHLSRGTGFLELYIKPEKLSASDWDVMAEGIRWIESVFPTFKNSRMWGSDPNRNGVYGYSGWNTEKGYISMHNPGTSVRKVRIRLDRKMGVDEGMKGFVLSSPIAGSADGLKEEWSYGETLTVELQPKEVLILDFDKD